MVTKLDASSMGQINGTLTPLIADVTESTSGTNRMLNFVFTSGVTKSVNLTQLASAAGVSNSFIDTIVNQALEKMVLIDPEMHGFTQSPGDVSPNNQAVPGFLVCIEAYTPWVPVWPPLWT